MCTCMIAYLLVCRVQLILSTAHFINFSYLGFALNNNNNNIIMINVSDKNNSCLLSTNVYLIMVISIVICIEL
jgi:hypothetical protein